MIGAKFLSVWEKLDNLDADTSKINDELLVICDEAVNLQKELDELKASIPKIKADAVDRFLHVLRYEFEGELTVDRIEDFASQLEGKE